jgi:hypothetical protein
MKLPSASKTWRGLQRFSNTAFGLGPRKVAGNVDPADRTQTSSEQRGRHAWARSCNPEGTKQTTHFAAQPRMNTALNWIRGISPFSSDMCVACKEVTTWLLMVLWCSTPEDNAETYAMAQCTLWLRTRAEWNKWHRHSVPAWPVFICTRGGRGPRGPLCHLMYCVHGGQFLTLIIRGSRRISFNAKEKDIGRGTSILGDKKGIGTNMGERREGDKSKWQKGLNRWRMELR